MSIHHGVDHSGKAKRYQVSDPTEPDSRELNLTAMSKADPSSRETCPECGGMFQHWGSCSQFIPAEPDSREVRLCPHCGTELNVTEGYSSMHHADMDVEWCPNCGNYDEAKDQAILAEPDSGTDERRLEYIREDLSDAYHRYPNVGKAWEQILSDVEWLLARLTALQEERAGIVQYANWQVSTIAEDVKDGGMPEGEKEYNIGVMHTWANVIKRLKYGLFKRTPTSEATDDE